MQEDVAFVYLSRAGGGLSRLSPTGLQEGPHSSEGCLPLKKEMLVGEAEGVGRRTTNG